MMPLGCVQREVLLTSRVCLVRSPTSPGPPDPYGDLTYLTGSLYSFIGLRSSPHCSGPRVRASLVCYPGPKIWVILEFSGGLTGKGYASSSAPWSTSWDGPSLPAGPQHGCFLHTHSQGQRVIPRTGNHTRWFPCSVQCLSFCKHTFPPQDFCKGLEPAFLGIYPRGCPLPSFSGVTLTNTYPPGFQPCATPGDRL